jgi:serine/threonine protein kinase/tetratricopeptide (TPR) repeat protein
MPLAVGTRLGSYEILSLLGVGGMGEVYRARDPALGRDVAIKVLRDTLAHDPTGLARFTREARAVAALNHPHIVTIFSIEEAGGIRFITMELVEGCTLDQLIPRGGIALSRFFEIAIALADALSAAHRKNLTHRDLKPANVMVSDDGRVKVLDFGLARAAEPEPGPVAVDDTRLPLTSEGAIVGTMPYMSPEQIEGKPLDPRSDIFSLGIVLYEMATGARPFGGDSSPALMSSILKDRPAAVAKCRPEVPSDVSDLIDRCLAKKPRDRIQTASEILAAFKAPRRSRESPPHKPASGGTPPSSERMPSIAVLPFTDMSAAKDQAWFCDGIAEEILNALAPLQGLRVAARTSAFSFKGKGHDLRTIGEKLNVTTVLEGSVRRDGDRVRITAQLNDAATGFRLWSERYDRELKGLFEIQDEIAKAIAERLRVTLSDAAKSRLLEEPTKNVEAYQHYLQGRALLNRRGASISPALALFRRAVEIDPNYSLAWAGIADAYNVMAYLGSAAGAELKRPAIAAATRAVEIDPLSAAGHTALACAKLMYENNGDVARHEFERALDLDPGYVQGRCWYALLYLQWVRGDYERGVTEARHALACDPLSAYATMFLATCLYTAGHLDEAIETGALAVERDPESFVAHWVLGISLGLAGRFEESAASLEAAAAIARRPSSALSIMAGVFAQSGRPLEAKAIHRELLNRASNSYIPLAHLVLTAEAAGQHEEAMAFARRAWDEREPTFILWARHFPHYRRLHSDPRFAAIVREMTE